MKEMPSLPYGHTHTHHFPTRTAASTATTSARRVHALVGHLPNYAPASHLDVVTTAHQGERAGEAVIERRLHANGCLVVTLNRPRALNALNMVMIEMLWQALRDAASDDAIKLIILKGAGDRAFCAGGDIRALAEESMKGNYAYPHRFFGQEYRLDCFIHKLKKPCIALMHGITMGGGVGLAIGCRYRVATEATVFAMPETAIGFYPDVGGTYYLSRLPDGIGSYAALLGARLGAADVLHCGIATHFVSKAKLSQLEHTLCTADLGSGPEPLLAEFTSEPEGQAEVVKHATYIKRYFDALYAEEIIKRLRTDESSIVWAGETLKALEKKSPTSIKVTLAALQRAKDMTIEEVYAMDLRVACRFMRSHDFVEGVAAVIIEKHHKPQWKPPKLEEVCCDAVDAFFAPFQEPSQELWV